jgi:stage II sporulation protein R
MQNTNFDLNYDLNYDLDDNFHPDLDDFYLDLNGDASSNGFLVSKLGRIKRMIFFSAVLVILCLGGVGGILFSRYRQACFVSRLARQVLRFHVIANSDSTEDQSIKLQVRDALIVYMASHADTFQSAEDAAEYAASHIEELEQVANGVLRSCQKSYSATISLGLSDFPDKVYGDLVFPAGTYEALRVELGQAQGENWWCVLYPLLCYTREGTVSVPEESETILEDSLSSEDYARLSGTNTKPIIRVKLWEWLKG